jgi:hypothetical protein
LLLRANRKVEHFLIRINFRLWFTGLPLIVMVDVRYIKFSNYYLLLLLLNLCCKGVIHLKVDFERKWNFVPKDMKK